MTAKCNHLFQDPCIKTGLFGGEIDDDLWTPCTDTGNQESAVDNITLGKMS